MASGRAACRQLKRWTQATLTNSSTAPKSTATWFSSSLELKGEWRRGAGGHLAWVNHRLASFRCLTWSEDHLFSMLSVPEDIFYELARRCYSISCLSQLCVFETRDMYHNIGPLDPERLNVFRTVREITGEVASPLKHLNEEERLLCRSCVCIYLVNITGLLG